MRQISRAVLVAACCATMAPTFAAQESLQDQSQNGNPMLFKQDDQPFGRGMATWGELATQWIYAQPFDSSPLFDPTGENCDVAQEGPVWHIARIAGPPVFSGTRDCTIPRDKAIFLYIGAVVDTYPCPFPGFEPAPGQSLYDFLAADARFLMDSVDHLEVSLDGTPIKNVFAYRYASPNLISIKGDVSLQGPMDPCITGDWQPAVVDGFFMMFRPLDPGQHVIRVHGTNTFGHDKTFTYFLTVV